MSDGEVTILVDALDEARLSVEETSIASFILEADFLPKGVRFVLTTRPDDNVLDIIEKSPARFTHINLTVGERGPDCSISAIHHDKSTEDITRYIQYEVEKRRTLESFLPADISDPIVRTIQQKGENNFLYIRYLFHMIEETGLVDLEALPVGLNRLYSKFLRRILSSRDDRLDCKPFLGVLAVAFDRLSDQQLSNCMRKTHPNLTLSEARERLGQILQLLTEVVCSDGQRLYGLYHRSFAEFLLNPDHSGRLFHCPAGEQHKRIVEYYLEETPLSEWDDYGVQYVSRHVVEGVKDWKNSCNSLELSQRHKLIQHLVDLIRSDEFQQKRSDTILYFQRGPFHNILCVQRDIQLGLEATIYDRHPRAPLLTIASAFAWEMYRESNLQPKAIFTSAHTNLEAAQAHLALFDISPAWYQAVLLSLTGLASESRHVEAQALLDRVKPQLLKKDVLAVLAGRVDMALTGRKSPSEDREAICELCRECPSILRDLSRLQSLNRYGLLS